MGRGEKDEELEVEVWATSRGCSADAGVEARDEVDGWRSEVGGGGRQTRERKWER